jgi:hypothetical protein
VFVTLIEALARMAQAEPGIGIGIGEMEFGLRESCILLLALAVALLSAVSLWRIAQSENRQNRLLDTLRRTQHRVEERKRAPRVPWHQQRASSTRASSKGF